MPRPGARVRLDFIAMRARTAAGCVRLFVSVMDGFQQGGQMRRVFEWMTLVVLCCAAGVEAVEQPSDARLREAQAAFDEATKLQEAGRYSEAIARDEHAIALWEAAYGDKHPEVARGLQLLGTLYLGQGTPSKVEPLYQRALEIRETALGREHPAVAESLTGLGRLYSDQGQYERAEPLLRRAMDIWDAAPGSNPLEVSTTLFNLANLYRIKGEFSRAEELFKRTIELRERAVGGKHPLVAQALSGLSIVYDIQGQRARVEPLLQRALSILEGSLGKNHPDVARVLNNLGIFYSRQGLYDRALAAHKRALAIREKTLDGNHPLVAASLGNLAAVYTEQGAHDQAVSLHERGLAITEAVRGKAHPSVATALSNLAKLYAAEGSLGRAEPLYQRALAIREEALGKNHPEVAEALNNLANIYREQGMASRAEPLYARAISIWETALGARHPHVAYPLNSLAILYRNQGLYEKAEPLLQRALALREEAFGKNHPEVADSLDTLANLYKDQALYDRARPLLEMELVIVEAARGRTHREVARALNNLGELYWRQGLYGRAEPLLRRALVVWQAAVGRNHPDVASTLGLLAALRLGQNRPAEALPLLTEAFAISERRLRQEGLAFSQSRMNSFLQKMRAEEERLYALLRAYPNDARVQRLALTASLLLKSRSTRESADTSRTVYQGLGPEDRELFSRLRGLRTRLAGLSFRGPGALTPAAYQQRLKELADEGDALEADLARRSAPLRALAAVPSPARVVKEVAAALPKDGALVEFIAYTDRPLVARPDLPWPKHPSESRYLALVLLPDASTRALDLGPAGPIDSAAARLRDALANRDASFEAVARELHQRVFQPLLPMLGGRHRLFISPDGQLSLVPFAALHDGQQFLIDTYDITYLTSGKDLLLRPQDKRRPGSAVVFADPDFSAPVAASPGKAAEPAERSPALERFFTTVRGEVAEQPWVPLPGTREEAEAIQRLIPQARLFLGPEANKEQLLRLSTPGVLHLATHGFFLDDAPVPQGSRAVAHFGALADNPLVSELPEPLLRSGILLAGVRAPSSDAGSPAQPSQASAWVTALELAGLNLWGTELVVLSACDTGRGEVQQGQGVAGLRRAFVVAGAETVVMSLWKVNDAITRQLMEAYYRNLLARQGRATALREAMRELRQTQPHPHYWAPFIAVGRDAPLRTLTVPPVETPGP